MKKLLADPELRRKLIVQSTIATQAREGIDVTEAEVEDSYYVVTQAARAAFFGLAQFRSDAGENDGRHIAFVRDLTITKSVCRIDVPLQDFSSITDSPLAYDKVGLLGRFFRDHAPLSPSLCETKQGLISTESARFVRYHWEVTQLSARRWVPYAKGGNFSRFFSDLHLVFDWTNDGADIKAIAKSRYGSSSRTIKCEEYYFRPGITWVEKTDKGMNARILPAGAIFNVAGPSAFPNDESNTFYILGLLNSNIAQAFLNCFGTRSWGVQYVGKLPAPKPVGTTPNEIAEISRRIYKEKRHWDCGNETSRLFTAPFVLHLSPESSKSTLRGALDFTAKYESLKNSEIQADFKLLNQLVYSLYNVTDVLKNSIEGTNSSWRRIRDESSDSAIGLDRPPELIWPQMEGKDTDQKRREHVERLLTYLVKQILEEDEDHLVCLQRVAHEAPLIARLREKLAACFPQQDPTALETEIVNELKKKTKGYHRAESLAEWLHDVFFETHNALYQQRPLLWHLASSQTRTEPGFACLVHAHHFDADALAKLRSVYIRDRIAVLKREAAQAGNDGKPDLRFDLLALAEEVEGYDAKLALLQEGAHTGLEGGDRDYRILTPWKSQEDRPQGWHPDVDDGIKVNLTPLARTNLLRRRLKLGEVSEEE